MRNSEIAAVYGPSATTLLVFIVHASDLHPLKIPSQYLSSIFLSKNLLTFSKWTLFFDSVVHCKPNKTEVLIGYEKNVPFILYFFRTV